MKEEEKFRTDVPPSIHVKMLEPLRKRLDVQGTPGREALVAAENALGSLYAGYLTLNDAIAAVKAARKSSQPTPPGQLPGKYVAPDLQRSAKIAFDNAAPKIDQAVNTLRKAREKIQKRIDEATADPEARSSVGIALAGQIREYVRTLKGNRVPFLFDRIKRGDRQTYNAVVNAPPYLSGMNEDEEKMVRELAANSWARDDVEQDKAAARAEELVLKGSQMFVDKYSGVISGEESAEAQAQRALKKLEGVGRG
jgi:hypothetical protein